MRITKTDAENTCCKCKQRAIYSVIHKDKTFHVCQLHKPTITDILRAEGHIVNLKGKEYVLFSGLLDLAHRNGLESLTSRIIHFDMEKGECVHEASATGARGSYIAHGDSTPENTGKMVASAFIRMSETRSYARVLRLYLGTGMCSKEELPPQ